MDGWIARVREREVCVEERGSKQMNECLTTTDNIRDLDTPLAHALSNNDQVTIKPSGIVVQGGEGEVGLIVSLMASTIPVGLSNGT